MVVTIQELADDAVAMLAQHRDATGDKLLSGNYTEEELDAYLGGFLVGYVRMSNEPIEDREPLELPSMNELLALRELIEEKLKT